MLDSEAHVLMDDLTDLLHVLRLELGIIYSLLLLFVGFGLGIFVWRWFKKDQPGSGVDALTEEMTSLEIQLELVVSAVADLWTAASPTTIDRSQRVGQIHSLSSPDHSRLSNFYRKTLGKQFRSRRSAGTVPASGDLKSRLGQAADLLGAQLPKINYLASTLPSRSNRPFATARQAARSDESFRRRRIDQSSPQPDFAETLKHQDEVRASNLEQIVSRSQSRLPERATVATGRADADNRVLELYNHAISDSAAREQFREQYQPTRIGTINAVERRQNPTAPNKPEFRESTDGDFFAFPSSEAMRYLVMPRLGLTIGAVSYNAGALGEMFGNPPYDPAQSYSRYRVRKPAIFKREDERWILETPGELDLGPSD